MKNKFLHLNGSLSLKGGARTNTCFHRASAFVLDVAGAELCFGTFRAATPEEIATIPNASTVPFIHCWAEFRDMVYAPTTIEARGQLSPIARHVYYEINGVTDIKRLGRPALLKVSKEIGLSAHLRKGKEPRASVGGSLLDAVGIDYRISSDGGVLPAN